MPELIADERHVSVGHASDDVRRTVLVTGSCRGIGAVIAQRLGAAGTKVATHSSDDIKGAERTADAIRSGGGAAHAFVADFVTPGCAVELAEQVARQLGSPSVLVLNAALQIRRPWDAITADDISVQVAVNLTAAIALIQASVPAMKRDRWGRIIVVGSVQQARPHPDMLVYAGLKSALENVTRNLARQLAPDGITVNLVAPGVIETDRNRSALEDAAYRRRVIDQIPVGRFGGAEECAEAVAFLASDAAGYITGTTIFVDGGMHLA